MSQLPQGLLPQFIQHLATCFASRQSTNLVSSVPLGPEHSYWIPIQQALSQTPPSSLTVEFILPLLSAIPSSTKDTFAAFILALLDNIRPPQGSTGFGGASRNRGEAGAQEAYGEFTRLLAVYTELNRLYGMSANGPYLHPFLNSLVLEIAKRLLPISRRAATLATSPSREPDSSRSIKDTTRQAIERSFQVASSPVTPGEWEAEVGKSESVGDIVWSLANILWRIYAERKLHTQAVEIRRTLQSLTPSEETRLTARSTRTRQADVCESWYWRGRLGVILLDMRGAKYALGKAWGMCPTDGWKQRRSILIRLIPINLLLGILPRQGVLEQYNLPEFVDLIRAFRNGDIAGWRKELERRREWLRSRSVWLILYERGEILVWRNLFRRTIYYSLESTIARNRCPTWIFTNIAIRAFDGSGEVEDGTIGIEDIICVISSLIDQVRFQFEDNRADGQGFILGNLSYSQQQLTMKPSADGMAGFPRISAVVPRTVTAVA